VVARGPSSSTPSSRVVWGHTPTPGSGLTHSNPLEPPAGDHSHADGAHRDLVSRNWSGYIATGSTFNAVSAQWKVPPVQPSSENRSSGTWIGIDGVSNSDLIQTGTAQSSGGGTTGYYAWYEVLPAAPVMIGPVRPGDQMSAAISYRSNDKWTVTIADVTSNNIASVNVTNAEPRTSAEWIEEAPTSSQTNNVVTLADFGTARFTDMGTASTSPGSVGLSPVEMTDSAGDHVIAYPSTISHNSFTVTYKAPPGSGGSGTGPPGPGYNLVGSDGGVFVFGGGYYGSLPGLGVHVDDVTGMVGTAKDNGYFLVGEDGGVFAFHAPFANSLPGIGVHVDDIVGIVPTLDDRGYFLVGRDGGVFSFNAPFENSLPGVGVSVDDIVGIAATSDDKGYWLVGSNGDVYAFGDAHYSGNAPVGAVGITATHDGGGYWVVGADGSVSAFGDAGNYGDLPVLGVSVDDIVGIVVSHDSAGYNLIGSDGGVFSFGDAVNKGSLPGLGVSVDDIVGAVPN
jgi:hypothetical protein